MPSVRSILTWFAPTRGYLIGHGVVALAGLISCFVPLFNLVGYESAALMGVVGGLAAMALTLHAVRCDVVAAPFDPARVHSPAADFFILLVRHLGLLIVPLAVLSLNALRVVNCAVDVGLAFWLVLSGGSLLCGQLLGWVATALFRDSTRGQNLFCLAVVGLSILGPLAHLALQPPIVGHQLFLGYFSGSIYDEGLSLPSSLVWYRLMHVAAAAVVLAIIEGFWRAQSGRRWHWMALLAVVGAVACSLTWWHRQDLGIAIDRDYIEAELDGRLETEHFVIHYPRTERFLRQRDELAEDHEYRYAELAEFFDTDPAEDDKIHSYVYASNRQKGRLMGASNTLVAKLWLHEMHIGWSGYGDHTLAHELAHIFTEPFGAGPLRLSTQSFVGVNMGLVEGAATAADWPSEQLTPHRAAAALRRLKLAPDIDQIVGASGFWTQSSGRAYTLVGSFVRYLIDEYGIEAFKKAYPTGDFARAYGTSAASLVDEWREHVDDLELSDEEMELARFLYDRPSIFDKVCARHLGDLQQRAQAAADQGRVGQMTDLYDRILDYAPDNVDYRISYARAYSRAGDHARARQMVDELLEDDDRPPVVMARLRQLYGDLSWRLERPDEAEEAYRDCLDIGTPVDQTRLLEVKLEALSRPADRGRSYAFEYLLGQKPSSVSLYFPMRWYRESNDDPLAAYLVGRRLWNERQWGRARPYLEAATEGLEVSILTDEATRMLGVAHYFEDRSGRAAKVFERLESSPWPYYRDQRREWLDRIAWNRGNRVRTQ